MILRVRTKFNAPAFDDTPMEREDEDAGAHCTIVLERYVRMGGWEVPLADTCRPRWLGPRVD